MGCDISQIGVLWRYVAATYVVTNQFSTGEKAVLVDKKEFFREITLRICGHLEIEEGLRACLEYLARHMPADTIYLQKNEPELGAMRLVARAKLGQGEKMDMLVPFAQDAKQAMAELAELFLAGRLPDILVTNKPREEPVSRCMLEALGEPPSSVMSLPLLIGGQIVGSLALLAQGEDRFTQEHIRLYTTLREPFFVAMSNILKHQEIVRLKEMLADDNRYLHQELKRLTGDRIIGEDFGLKNVMALVRSVSGLDSPVLLLGETGVGKDVIANAIHYASPRRDEPFIKVNCGAIPETLMDNELFGHEKGAFTGALSQKRGRFERAHGGTIFLDEIAELPQPAQVRLLRVLQSGEIERVGGSKTIAVDNRIIAATHQNLEEMTQSDRFREDLWFRLNVFPIIIPPLRQRKEDIPALVNHLIERKSMDMKLPNMPGLAKDAMEQLMAYDWPGNVRELENIVERTLILDRTGPLDFKNVLVQQPPAQDKAPAPSKSEHFLKLDQAMSLHISRALKMTNGRIHGPNGAAELLGINPSTLRTNGPIFLQVLLSVKHMR
jgi:transcriptional regulator with GAF, ATPase, and Fis domain